MKVSISCLALLAVLLASCANTSRVASGPPAGQKGAATVACQPLGFPFGPREYIWPRESAREALGEFTAKSGTAARVTGADARRMAVARAQSSAEIVKRKLDDIERGIETLKLGAGECFGKGEFGMTLAQHYAWAIEAVRDARQKMQVELTRMHAENKAVTEQETNFERWRQANRDLLVRETGGMSLEVLKISKSDVVDSSRAFTVISINATNTTASRILMPVNSRVWGYEAGSDIGGRLPIGASLTDSFGNSYKLTSISPSYLGSEARGVRPGQTVTFQLTFGDVPLPNARSVRLVLMPSALGQMAAASFDIPAEAFYWGNAGRP